MPSLQRVQTGQNLIRVSGETSTYASQNHPFLREQENDHQHRTI